MGSGELVSVGKLSQHISTGHKIFNVCIDISWLLDFFFFLGLSIVVQFLSDVQFFVTISLFGK